MVDSNAGVATAQTNNKGLVAEIDEKLNTINKRLSDIAGYKEIPPAIAEEKESLQKRKDILLATRSRLADETPAPSGAPASPPPPPTPAPSATPPVTPAAPAPVKDEFKPAPVPPIPLTDQSEVKPTIPALNQEPTQKLNSPTPGGEKANLSNSDVAAFGASESNEIELPHDELDAFVKKSQSERVLGEEDKGDANDDLIGKDYAVLNENNNHSKKSDVFTFRREESDEGQLADDLEIEEGGLTQRLAKVDTGKLFQKIADAIGLFASVVDSNPDHPDRDYLSRAIQRLKDAVDGLESKSKEVKMTESQLKQAILGRASGYIKLAEAEFEFSGLLDRDFSARLRKILDEAK